MNSVTDRPKAGSLLMRVLTRERTLLLLFGLYMAGCFLLFVYLRNASHESVESAALAKARIAAAFIVQQGASGEPQAIDGIQVRRIAAG